MKPLLKLYPRSWRRRYGREMEVLLEDLPREAGVGLDLILGAAAAYATVIRGNRILSAAGSFLHGVCVAVLLQAIAFVTFILVGLSAEAFGDLRIGPVHLATFVRSPYLFGEVRLFPALASSPLAWVPAALVLAVLVGASVIVLLAPRWVRTAAR